MRITDIYLLARTKRRTRRVRSAVTVVVSAILFALLLFVVLLFGGVSNSVQRMTDESIAGRYIVGGIQNVDYMNMNAAMNNPDAVAEATRRYDALVAAKTAEAKKLGIEYDKSSDPNPVDTVEGKKSLNVMNDGIGREVNDEWMAKLQPVRSLDDFKRFARDYQPSDYYRVLPFAPKRGQVIEMKQGKESFEQTTPTQANSQMPDYTAATVAPTKLISNYLFKDTGWQASSGTIPVVVTQKRAEQLTGLTSPNTTAPAAEKLSYGTTLQRTAHGKTFELCYRNSASRERVDMARDQAKQMQANAGNKSYQKPSVIYQLPSEDSCGEVTVASDTRTATQKQYDAKQDQFDRKFNKKSDPVQRKLTFQVVGVAPNTYAESNMGYSTGISDMVATMFMSNGMRFAIPSELYAQMTSHTGLDQIIETDTSSASSSMSLLFTPGYYAEFTNADAARRFTKEQTCTYGPNGCGPTDKWFALSPYGSNSLALEDLSQGTVKVILWAGLVVMLLAAVIASLTISRTIADSRRETAVFRAIGFRRSNIVAIYTVYTLMLSTSVLLFALIIALAGAMYLESVYSIDTTARLKLLLAIPNSINQFHFVGWSPYLWYVIAAVYGAGLLGMIVPLLRNVRRNPIRDMRDE